MSGFRSETRKNLCDKASEEQSSLFISMPIPGGADRAIQDGLKMSNWKQQKDCGPLPADGNEGVGNSNVLLVLSFQVHVKRGCGGLQ